MTRETADGLAGPTVGYAEGYYETWTYNNSGLADAAGTRHPEPTEGRVVFVKNSSLSVTETFIKPLSSDGNVTFKIQNLTNTWIKWAGGVSFSLKDVSGRVINSGMELNLPMDSINVRYEGTSREERKTYSVDYYCFDSKENLSSDLYVVDYGVVGYPIVSGSPLYDTCTVRGSEEINILLADSDDDGE